MSGSAGLRGILIQSACCQPHEEDYLSAQYHRIAARRGKKGAALAVTRTILEIIYYLIRDSTNYRDLGPNHFDQRQQQATINRAIRRVEQLGYRVAVEAA
jgi:transposase